ncbi:MAG: penicillin acylase family protein [Spirochaetes bacterium]|nr:penicillin acylase family protein [Spirochaetota bacterium]
MRKSLRNVIIAAGCVIVVVAVLFGTWKLILRRSYPKTRGTVTLEGLAAPVDIYRDKNGIPHIYAQTEDDLFFAQGYVHAQDRFWQMEFWRRIGSGRLAELFGEAVLGTDIYLRTVGFARIAQEEYVLIDADLKRILDAYAAGVNAYILNKKPRKLGLEFSLLKLTGVEFEIEPWEPVNTLTWIKVMSQDLGSNMEVELKNIEMIRAVGLEMAADFLPPYREDEMPYIVSDDELIFIGGGRMEAGLGVLDEERLSIIATLDTGLAGGFDPDEGLVFGEAASNSWVVSGTLTSTKTALLANDPHLSVQMPSIWYEIGLHCEENGGRGINVRGFSFAGVPGVVVGHNDRIAWGMTNLYPDTQDLYIERINPENPNQYEVNGEWVYMELASEEIAVHDEDYPYRLLVRSTRHGPIVTDHGYMLDYSNFGVASHKTFPENLELTALSLRWAALRHSTALKSLILLNRARNFEEFREALRYWDTPSQNFVYADTGGNIGYQAPGLIPIRAKGEGLIPAPGWTDEYEWEGYIPYDELPYLYNPDKGFIVTANNPVVSNNYPYLIGRDFDEGYRAKRITDMIEADADGISVEDVARMQGDCLNLSAIEVLPYLRSLSFEDGALENAKKLLLDWDANMQMESPAAALYGYFWQKLIEETFKDQLMEKLWPPRGSWLLSLMYKLLREPENRWWDDVTTLDAKETRDEILALAFEKAYKTGVDELGDDPADWRWGDIHVIVFRNQTFGESGIGPIEAVFNSGPVPVSGGIQQVNRCDWMYDEPFEAKSITSMRQIIDLGDLSASLTMHTTGQSGHPGHTHYDDLIDPWRLVQYHPTLWEKGDVEKSSKHRLILKPAK